MRSLALLVLIATPAFAQDALVAKREADQVRSTISSMLHAIDNRNWASVRSAFVDEVFVDYTSLNGGEPGPQAADDLVGGWKATLPGFEATQHLTGPMTVTVEGDDALAMMAVTATHRMDGLEPSTVWQVGGHYRVGLARSGDRWLVDALTLDTAYVLGDTGLPAKAREIVKERQ